MKKAKGRQGKTASKVVRQQQIEILKKKFQLAFGWQFLKNYIVFMILEMTPEDNTWNIIYD